MVWDIPVECLPTAQMDLGAGIRIVVNGMGIGWTLAR